MAQTSFASKKEKALTSAYLIYDRRELTGEFVVNLFAKAMDFTKNKKSYVKNFFVDDLTKRYPQVSRSLLEMYFENFYSAVLGLAEHENFKNTLTKITENYEGVTVVNIMENKEVRLRVNGFFENNFMNIISRDEESFFRRDLKFFLIHRLHCAFVEMGITKKQQYFCSLITVFDLNLNWITAIQTKKLALLHPPNMQDMLTKIDSISPPPLYRLTNEEKSKVLVCFKKSLLDLYLRNYREISSGVVYQQAYDNLVNIIIEIFNRDDILLYLSKWENSSAVLDRIFSCLIKKQLILSTMTCPDYSGYYAGAESGESDKKFWVFDFESLQNGEGIVAQKAYPYVVAMYSIFKKYIPGVRIKHDLPTFEFPISEGFRNILSKNQTTEILTQSLLKIKKRYADDFGINVMAGLTCDTISDKIFEQQRIEIKKMLYEKYQTNSKFKEFVEYVFKSRKGMYRKWYPRLSIHDNDENYRLYLIDRVMSQLSDYWIAVKAYSLQENVFLLFADSPILAGVWSFANAPALSGQGSKSIGYAE